MRIVKIFQLFCFIVLIGLLVMPNSVYANSLNQGWVEDPSDSGNWVTSDKECGELDAEGGNSVLIKEEATVTTGDDQAIHATGGYTVENNGTVESGYIGILVDNGGDNTVNNNGTINVSCDDDGDLELYGIKAWGKTNPITNTGTFSVTNSGNLTNSWAYLSGIEACSTMNEITNSGDFNVTNSGNLTNSWAYLSGIKAWGETSAITNSGTFSVTNSGNLTNSGAYLYGIEAYRTMNEITNSGDINVTNSGNLTNSWAYLYGIEAYSTMNEITNSGDINVTNSGNVDEGSKVELYGIKAWGKTNTITNTGTIRSGTGIYMDGDGAITNSGIIEGTGGTAIQLEEGDQIVTLQTGSQIIGNIEDNVGIGDNDEVILEGTGAFAHRFINMETLTKEGPGAWIFTHANIGTFHDVAVNEGTLQVNGILTTGDYTQYASATLGLGVEGENPSRIDVTNTATINGGNVQIVHLGYYIADGSTYDIMTYSTLEGAFDDVTAQSAVLSFALDYATPSKIQVIADRTSYADVPGINPNLRSIANNLQGMLGTGDMEEILLQLDSLPDADALNDAFRDMTPEAYAALCGMSFTGINLFQGSLMGRLGGLRLAPSESKTKYADSSDTLTDSGPVLANVPPALVKNTGRLSGWVDLFGTFVDQDRVDNNSGFKYDTGGVALGIDTPINENWVLGISMGFANTDVDFDNANWDSEFDAYHFGIYGSYNTESYYIDTAFSYARNEYDSDRLINFGGINRRAESDHDGNDYSIYLGGGYNLNFKNWNFIPTLSLQYTYHDEESFTENGAGGLNLHVDAFDADSVMSQLGFRLGRSFQVKKMKMDAEFSAKWAHEYADIDHMVTARFAGTTAGSFTVAGIEPDRDSALLGLAITAQVKKNIKAYLSYDSELREDFDAQTISGGIRVDF